MVVPVPLVDGLRVHLLPVQDRVVVPEHLPVVVVEPRARLVERGLGEVGVCVSPRAAILSSAVSCRFRAVRVKSSQAGGLELEASTSVVKFLLNKVFDTKARARVVQEGLFSNGHERVTWCVTTPVPTAVPPGTDCSQAARMYTAADVL